MKNLIVDTMLLYQFGSKGIHPLLNDYNIEVTQLTVLELLTTPKLDNENTFAYVQKALKTIKSVRICNPYQFILKSYFPDYTDEQIKEYYAFIPTAYKSLLDATKREDLNYNVEYVKQLMNASIQPFCSWINNSINDVKNEIAQSKRKENEYKENRKVPEIATEEIIKFLLYQLDLYIKNTNKDLEILYTLSDNFPNQEFFIYTLTSMIKNLPFEGKFGDNETIDVYNLAYVIQGEYYLTLEKQILRNIESANMSKYLPEGYLDIINYYK